MPKKQVIKKWWAVLMWGELQNPRHIFFYRHEAENFKNELLEEPNHCSTCDCEGLHKTEVRVVSVEISLSQKTNKKVK